MVLCIPCFWTLASMQQVSLVRGGVLFTLYLGLTLLPQFPGGLKNLHLSTHLRISTSDFQITKLPVSWHLANSFSFIVILRIDSRSQTWWGSFSLVLAAHHRIHKSFFCCWWAIVRGRVLNSFRHGTNHNALSNPGKKTFEMATRINRETHCMQPTNTGGDSTHLLRNFLKSECRRACFWCLHIRFALWFPKWSYRTTNQAQLSVGSGHVSHRGTRNPLSCSIFCVLLTCWVLVLELRTAPVSWWLVCLDWASLSVESNTSITMSQSSRASNPSIHNSASREMISDSVEMEDCFLHIQLMGQMFRFPKKHKTPPGVDFESSRSPTKSVYWN